MKGSEKDERLEFMKDPSETGANDPISALNKAVPAKRTTANIIVNAAASDGRTAGRRDMLCFGLLQ